MTPATSLMLDTYRSVWDFAQRLRCADRAPRQTYSDIRFVLGLRARHWRKSDAMRMTAAEHQRLQALAVRGGWADTKQPNEEAEYAY